MRELLKKVLLIIILIVASGSALAAPVEQVICDELAAMYRLDTSQYTIEVLKNRLETTDVDPGQLTIRPLSEKEPIGLFSVAVSVEKDDVQIERAQVRLRITRFATVLVAADRVGMRDDLTREMVSLRRMDVTNLREKVLTSFEDIEGYRAARNLRKGSILTSSDVEIPPDIEAGRDVSIVYDDGFCRISTPGTALQPGSAGDYVKVKNKSSGKIIMARVKDETAVVVDP